MKQHHYRVTVERVLDADGNAVEEEALIFDMPSREKISDILAHYQEKPQDFEQETAVRFVVGLRLLGEVLLENRKHPFFSQLEPHFREIMHTVKSKKPQ
ncbi:MAG: DUF3861 domain-containing protein [Cardiobacteriaceae bacterium]|nr:DUF3861 domain-containing protein [Cardiobacteriaceae bacterium]